MLKPHLSVIVPAYNEEKNFKAGKLAELYSYLQKQKYTFEILLVDDGSADTTLQLCRDFARGKAEVRVLGESHKGKAPTVTAGMMAALGELRLYTDFDQSTPISEVEKLLPFINNGYDIVIGSREIKGAKRDREPWYRHLMGRVFNLAVQTLTIRGIQDTQCGFKLFTDKATVTLFPKLKIYGGGRTRKDAFTGAFDVELLYLAQKLGFKIAEVPVHWKHFKTERVSPIKDSVRMFMDIVKIRFADLTRQYEN